MSTPEESVPGGAMFKPAAEPTFDDVSDAVIQLFVTDGVRYPLDPANVRKILGYGSMEVIVELIHMLLHGPNPVRDWWADHPEEAELFRRIVKGWDPTKDPE